MVPTSLLGIRWLQTSFICEAGNLLPSLPLIQEKEDETVWQLENAKLMHEKSIDSKHSPPYYRSIRQKEFRLLSVRFTQ